MFKLVKQLDKDIAYAIERRDAHRVKALLDNGKRSWKDYHTDKARFFSGMARGLKIARERVA